MNSMTYSTYDTFFYYYNLSIPVNRSNFTLAFLRLLVMIMFLRKENKQSQVHIFQDKSFQIHQPMKNHFESTNHESWCSSNFFLSKS